MEPEILDKKEKEYLSAVIKPFRDEIKCIGKYRYCDDEHEFIYCKFINSNNEMSFPDFKKDTMYKGMKLNKEYTLKELGL